MVQQKQIEGKASLWRVLRSYQQVHYKSMPITNCPFSVFFLLQYQLMQKQLLKERIRHSTGNMGGGNPGMFPQGYKPQEGPPMHPHMQPGAQPPVSQFNSYDSHKLPDPKFLGSWYGYMWGGEGGNPVMFPQGYKPQEGPPMHPHMQLGPQPPVSHLMTVINFTTKCY